jgi:ParB-like chromosome segregation protein Spo0J
MKIEQIAIEKIIPYARNSRTHSDAQVAQIAASIREFGFTNPVLVDEADGIIAGHGRVLAARKLAMDKVPAIRLKHLSEAQKRAYVIADNRLALNAGWDEEMLAAELGDLAALDFDLDLLGFDEAELANLMGDDGTAKPPEDFPEYDEEIPTEHECPKCGYTWSGNE